MILKDKVFSALWGGAGMLVMLSITTVWDNKEAIALNMKSIEDQSKIGNKVDQILAGQNDLTGKFSILESDFRKLGDNQRRQYLAQARMEHQYDCLLEIPEREHESRRQCFAKFDEKKIIIY